MKKKTKLLQEFVPTTGAKRAQEEIVGFVVIIVIIAVIMLVLLWFLLNDPSESVVESFEIESFILATLQYTTNCESSTQFLSVQSLIIACEEGDLCLDNEKDSCIALNETLTNIMGNSWVVNAQSAIKGYKLSINVNEEENLLAQEGNKTTEYKGAFQDFARGGNDYKVILNIYY